VLLENFVRPNLICVNVDDQLMGRKSPFVDQRPRSALIFRNPARSR